MKSILIIEDSVDIRENCSEILELSGYNVFQSENGRTGVEMAILHRPDLILCDIMMPDLDGYGVLYLLGKNISTAEIPFIFLTAKTEHSDFRKAMEMGADDFLIKPFNDVELLQAIEARINKCQRQKKYYSTIFQSIENLTVGNQSENGIKELRALTTGRKIKQLKKKQILYYDGDSPQGLYIVIDGCIKTVKQAQGGRPFITGLYKADDYIGLDALLLDEIFTETAEAIEDSSVCLLPKNLIIPLLNKYPEISRQFIRILSKDIHEKEEQLVELAYLSVRKRISQVLIRLSKKSATQGVINISREELAALAGVAIETISRTLSDFKDEGLIEKNGNIIELKDVNRIVGMKN
ncbi:Transcriptional activator protein Anr [compost metagenome]